MFCQKCGTEFNDGAQFCPSCGTKAGATGAGLTSVGSSNSTDLMGNHMKYGIVAVVTYLLALVAFFIDNYSYCDGYFSATPYKIITKGKWYKWFFLKDGASWWHVCYVIIAIVLGAGLFMGIKNLYIEISKKDYTKKGLNICVDLSKALPFLITFYVGGVILHIVCRGAFQSGADPEITLIGWIVPVVLIAVRVYVSKEISSLAYKIKVAEVAQEGREKTTSSDISIVAKAPVKRNATDWKCPDCGRYNPSYCGTCGCGRSK